MISFKDKRPEFFRMGSGDNLVYSVGAVDEYLAVVEPMAEKWESIDWSDTPLTEGIAIANYHLLKKLKAVRELFNELPDSTVSHLCSVLYPIKKLDGVDVYTNHTLYDEFKKHLEDS